MRGAEFAKQLVSLLLAALMAVMAEEYVVRHVLGWVMKESHVHATSI